MAKCIAMNTKQTQNWEKEPHDEDDYTETETKETIHMIQ